MPADLNLLFPEWQGYGEHTAVYHGARKIARELFGGEGFIEVPVRAEERLETRAGVLGLTSIAARLAAARALLARQAPRRIFMVGGTCAAEIAPVAYLNRLHGGRLAVLWFDAHGDLHTPESSPSGHFHGMPLRSLLGEGPQEIVGQVELPITPRQVFLVGARDLDPPEVALVAERSLHVTASGELGDGTGLCRAIEARGFTEVYVHFDLDVLDPAAFPDVLMHTHGGSTPSEIARVLRRLTSRFGVVGFSIVEYCERSGRGIEALRALLDASGMQIGCCRAAPGSSSVPEVDPNVALRRLGP